MSENKVNGPEDAVVSEMIKQLPQENLKVMTECFQESFMGQMEGTRFMEDLETGVFFTKTRCGTKEEIRSYRALALASVMSKWHESSFTRRLEQEQEPEGWKKLHVGGTEGISCQHCR